MKCISTGSGKNPGHYSAGVAHGGILYVSGQLPVDPETGQIPSGGADVQTRQALANVERVLHAAGITRNDVILCRVYTPDVSLWDSINAAYAAFFGEHRPARVVVPTTALHYGCLVEIEATAALPETESVPPAVCC